MAINLENELKTISARLKALSKKVDTMAAGIVIPKPSKRKSAVKKGASLAAAPMGKNAPEIMDEVGSVLVPGAGDLEPEMSIDPGVSV